MDGNEFICDGCGLKSAEPMWRDFSHLKKRIVSHCDDCCSYVELNAREQPRASNLKFHEGKWW